MNKYILNRKKKSFKKVGIFSDSDPLFHETDPRIYIKMKQTRNTDF